MPQRYFRRTQIHNNGDLVCAVDTETTGLDGHENSIIELAVVPLNPDFTRYKELPPFTMMMQPIEGKKIEQDALKVNKIDLPWVMLNCLPAYRVLDLFLEWFSKLELGEKKIIPLAQNWPFDYWFLNSWMGKLTFAEVFSRKYLDTMVLANALNDRAALKCRPIPHPKYSLSSLAKHYDIENPDPHRALGDAVTTAEVYRRLLEESSQP